MTSPPDDTTTDTSAIITALRTERDAALAREAVLAEALTQRNSEYGERIEQQSATIDVLKVMSASPDDAGPVFELIAERAREFCEADKVAVALLEGDTLHLQAHTVFDEAFDRDYVGQFPRPLDTSSVFGRAIFAREAVQSLDLHLDPQHLSSQMSVMGLRSIAGVPIIREGRPIGAISLARRVPGPYSAAQVELLQTFAEQAVIAITSAETYRALQTRTSDLQESLEYQTATSDVLKVISGSDFELDPVFRAVVTTAARLCLADQATIYRYEDGEYGWAAGTSMPADYERIERSFRTGPGRGSLVGRVALEKGTVQILDAWNDPLYTLKDDARVGGVRTMLGVPLMRDGVPIGVIAVARYRVEPFTDRQIELVSTFADQAVIAIENTRLLTEQREGLEQQTATAEVLQVINASPGDLKPVFDAMLEKAMRLCGAAFGSLYTYNGERFRTAAQCGVPPAYAEHRAITPPTARSGSPLERLVKTKGAVHILDLAVDEGYLRGDAIGRALLDIGGARTALMVPLLKDESVVGAIVIYRQEVQAFSQKQIALVENFAAQAVIAIENARLLDEIRQRTNDLQQSLEYQTATSDVLKVISRSTFDLKPVLEALLSIAKRLCDADYAMVSQREANGFRALSTQSASAEWAAALEGRLLLENRSSVTGRAALTKRPVQIADADADPDYALSGAVAVGHTRTCLGVPLLRDGVVVGAIALARTRVEPFTDRQIELVSTFADQAVIAIENTRLITEQREALERQTATAEVLQVINASPGDLKPVFDAVLEKAHNLCGVTMGALLTYDGDMMRAQATRGYSEQLEALVRQPRPLHLSELVRGERFLHVPDMTAPEFMRSDFVPRFAEQSGARTYLAVALRKDGRLIGMISAIRTEVRPFSDKEITLLENFAAQAVIAMENARLLTEQREALEQQTATAEILQVINTNPGNLTPVFDTVIAKAMRLCGAAFGALYIYDGERFITVSTRGVPSAFAEYRAQNHPTGRGPNSRGARILKTKQSLHIPDVMADESYLYGDASDRAAVDLGGARTLLLVPLLNDATVLGIIVIYRQEVRAFSAKQIALLESFAAQAVIAMENARLLTEQREALEQQTATAEVLQVINSSPGNLAPVFDTMLEKALTLCGAEHGSLGTYDGDYFRAVASRGYPAAVLETLQGGFHGLENPVTRPLFDGARFVQIPDLGEIDHPIPKAIAALGGFRTVLFVPLRKDGKLLGHISASRQEVRPFAVKEIALLENFAVQAVIAMENARLLDEIRQRQAELRVTFENMGDGVAMFDETPSLVAWNRKFQDILDLPDGVLAERLAFPDYIRYLTERGEYGEGAHPEEQIRRLTGQPGEVRAYERTRPDGRVIEIRRNPVPSGGFVLIFSDITERKRNEAEIRAARDAAEEASRTIEAAYRDLKTAQANLIQAEKMASLGQLTAGIAHEIKNPLNFVNNFSALSTELIDELRDVLAREPLGKTARTEVDDLTALLKGNLEKVVQHGQRADGIVRSMLDHSRGSSGERRTVDLNTLADEALNLAYHGARAQDQSFNITLERDFGEGIAPIEVNPQDITRVFLNIFSNGFYATTRRAREGGGAGFVPTLKVTTRDAGEAVEIHVRDNGTGVPTDIRDKLFQPFFTTKPTGEGTGLGLSITYDIVTQQHGGNIAVDSKVGEYSEFTIQLPRQRP